MSSKTKARVLLIVPPIKEYSYEFSGKACNPPHSGMAYIGTMIKQSGAGVRIVDGTTGRLGLKSLFDLFVQFSPNIVGITATTPEFTQAAKIAEEIKKYDKGIITILGGVHISMLPRETLMRSPHIDMGVLGEGERTIEEIIKRFTEGRSLNGIDGTVVRQHEQVTLYPPAEPIKDLDSIPFPDWSMFDLNNYYSGYRFLKGRFELPVQTKRGCPYRCIFCSRPWGTQTRYRSLEGVLGEIENDIARYGAKEIVFVDETFTLNRKYTIEMCEGIIRSGLNKKITWKCATRASDVDPELLLQMKKAGCHLIFYGLESGDEQILRIIKKDITLLDARNAIAWSKKAGIKTSATFVIGWPFETMETIEKTLRFSRELDSDYVHFIPLMALPKTELSEMARIGTGNLVVAQPVGNHIFPYQSELKSIDKKVKLYKQVKGYLFFYIRPNKILNLIRYIQLAVLFKIILYKAVRLVLFNKKNKKFQRTGLYAGKKYR